MAVSFIRLKNNFRLIYPLWNVLQTLRLNSDSKDSVEMETFISDLTQRRANKWNELRKETETLSRNQSQDEIASDEQHALIEEIYNCLDSHDDGDELENVIDEWRRKYENPLPRELLDELFEFASGVGKLELFRKLVDHVRDFDVYHDEAIVRELEYDWKTGKNIDQLIDRFQVLFRNSVADELKMKRTMKFYSIMIKDCVGKRGESVVLRLRDKIEPICIDTGNYRLLFDLWRKLFESFWFSDQQLAAELMSKHAPLRGILSKQLSVLCFIYLRNNNTELVNRLIQIFLQFNMMRQVEMLVKILFDFECWRRNMDAVLQIVQLCLKLDIQLTTEENKKFLDLLLKRPRDDQPKTKEKITIQKYQFKF